MEADRVTRGCGCGCEQGVTEEGHMHGSASPYSVFGPAPYRFLRIHIAQGNKSQQYAVAQLLFVWRVSVCSCKTVVLYCTW